MQAPACQCHGEPQYFVKDSRYTAGGFWRCGVTHRAKGRAVHERRMDDPMWRNARRLRQARLKRAVTRAKHAGPRDPKVAAFLAVTRKG